MCRSQPQGIVTQKFFSFATENQLAQLSCGETCSPMNRVSCIPTRLTSSNLPTKTDVCVGLQEKDSMKKLFVGNLPHSTTEAELRTLFEPHGKVDQVSLVTDRDTGRSRGFAFVEMADAGEAEKAIAALNGKELGGRALNINEARPRTDRGSRRTARRQPSRRRTPRRRRTFKRRRRWSRRLPRPCPPAARTALVAAFIS